MFWFGFTWDYHYFPVQKKIRKISAPAFLTYNFSKCISWCQWMKNMNGIWCWGSQSITCLTLPDSSSMHVAFLVLVCMYFSFYLSRIALECCVGFCRTTTWISRRYTYIPPSWAALPIPPSHPSRSSPGSRLSPLCYAEAPHELSKLYMAVCICQCYSQLVLPSSSPTVSICPFSTSLSLFLPCIIGSSR